jgi:hypothetical protein
MSCALSSEDTNNISVGNTFSVSGPILADDVLGSVMTDLAAMKKLLFKTSCF